MNPNGLPVLKRRTGQPLLPRARLPVDPAIGARPRYPRSGQDEKPSTASSRGRLLRANLRLRQSVSNRPPPTDFTLQRRVLSDGAECFLPIRYFDVQCLVATFLAAPDRASELLVGAGLQPVLQEDGRAVVDLYCIEYRKTDIGPYNEVGLTIRAKAPGDPIAANYVVNLPVTTAVANRAGREIWGYNKFVAAIDVNSEGKTFSTVLRDSDHEIIGALEGKRSVSVPAPATDILTFSLHQGRLIKTRHQSADAVPCQQRRQLRVQSWDVEASDDGQPAGARARWRAPGSHPLHGPVSGSLVPRPSLSDQARIPSRAFGPRPAAVGPLSSLVLPGFD